MINKENIISNKMKVTILGRHGLLGSALTRELESEGWEVTPYPDKESKFLFNLASTVHPPFEENPEFHTSEILSSFMYLLPFCRENNIKFIYPSSALVYENRDLNFIKVKKIMELYASMYSNTLGLRIFPVYGGGETRTAIYQFCKSMKRGESPVIYGDGFQYRDFIYIDDAISQIMTAMESGKTGIIDIGIGNPITFNKIVETINDILGTNIKSKHIAMPDNYSEGILCQDPGKQMFSLEDGIKEVLKTI